MAKWKVTYELRSTHTRTVEADSLQEAEDLVCEESYRRHRQSVYDILETEQIEGKVHKIYEGAGGTDVQPI